MRTHYRQIITAGITFIGGFYFFLEFILPAQIGEFKFGKYHDQISTGVMVVGAMAIGLGIINILRIHGSAILKTSRGWMNSLALLGGMFIMLAVAGSDLINSEKSVSSWKYLANLQTFPGKVLEDFQTKSIPAAERIEALGRFVGQTLDQIAANQGPLRRPSGADKAGVEFSVLNADLLQAGAHALLLAQEYRAAAPDLARIAALSRELSASLKSAASAAQKVATANYENAVVRRVQRLLENGFFFPLGAAMFSLLAFYIATAAYRSFRVRSLEALIMMIAAVVVMLGQIPHGPLYVWDKLPAMRLWLLQNLSTPAFRAVYFGAAIAGLAMSVRMWLSLERSPLSTGDDK